MLGIRLRNDWVYYTLFQYFWILVILPKAVQLVCLGALMCLIWFQSGREKPLDKFTLLQLVFLLIYGVAIVMNALSGDHELTRIFAAANTWAITAVAIFLYHLYRHAQLDLTRIGKYSLCNLVILILLWLVHKVTGGISMSIFGHTMGADDWINGVYKPRFIGFLDYANLVVFCVLFFYPLSLRVLSQKRWLMFVLTLLLYPVVAATNSRSGQLLYLVVILAYVAFEAQKLFFQYYQKRRIALLAIAAGVAVLIGLVLFQQIAGVVQSILEQRESSNNMRMYLYQQSLETMLQQSPLLGIGIKSMPATGPQEYPLGSHSTYIGVFYKAGIFGGLLYMISVAFAAVKRLVLKDTVQELPVCKVCLLGILLLMAFEDVDGANWCVCVFYILLALMKNSSESSCSTATGFRGTSL